LYNARAGIQNYAKNAGIGSKEDEMDGFRIVDDSDSNPMVSRWGNFRDL
jgi:hypothetical protein